MKIQTSNRVEKFQEFRDEAFAENRKSFQPETNADKQQARIAADLFKAAAIVIGLVLVAITLYQLARANTLAQMAEVQQEEQVGYSLNESEAYLNFAFDIGKASMTNIATVRITALFWLSTGLILIRMRNWFWVLGYASRRAFNDAVDDYIP